MGKYGLAQLDFRRALQADKANNAIASVVGVRWRAELLYNLGLTLLLLREPAAAQDFFERAADVMYNNALIWLRLAECRIMQHEEEQMEARRQMKRLYHFVGSGEDRGLLLVGPQPVDKATIAWQPVFRDLQNALLLLRSGAQTAAAHAGSNSHGGSAPRSPILDGTHATPVFVSAVAGVQVYVQIKLAFVSLMMGSVREAHEHALAVTTAAPSVAPGAVRLIAHLYAAEALLAMNAPDKALLHLSPSLLAMLSEDSAPSSGTSSPETSRDPADAGEGPPPTRVPAFTLPTAKVRSCRCT